MERTEAEEEAFNAAQHAHQLDPENVPAPQTILDYELYLPDTVSDTLAFKRKFDIFDEDRDDQDLYPFTAEDGKKCIRFRRIRAYETAKQLTYGTHGGYEHDLIFSVCDGDDGTGKAKAVYYSPIIQETSIRPQRHKNINSRYNTQEDDRIVDFVDVTIEDPTEDHLAIRRQFIDNPLGSQMEQSRRDSDDADSDAEVEADKTRSRTTTDANDAPADGDLSDA